MQLLFDGTLTQIPLYASLAYLLLSSYALWSFNTIAIVAALSGSSLVSLAVVAGHLSSKLSSAFWLLNTFNGWITPVIFHCLDHVLSRATMGNPESVIRSIDEFCWNGPLIMNVGDVKGEIVDAEIKKCQPKVAMELGAHMGYSTVRFSSILPEGSLLHSVEPEPMGHSVGMALLRFAGLADRVVAEFDFSGNVMKRFASEGRKIDFLFIDHVKELYLCDLQLALSLGILNKGCVVVADNVLLPGAPDYKEWMLAGDGSKLFKTQVHETFVEYSKTMKDEVLVSTYMG